MTETYSPYDIAYSEAQVISNQARSKVFQERLHGLLETCDPASVPVFNRKFSREWFAEQIGCAASTLTTNPRLRYALSVWEEKHRSIMVSGASRKNDDETNVVRLPRKKSSGKIYAIPVTVSAGLKPQTKDVPTLLWEEGIDEWVADHARDLIFRSKLKASSVGEIVKKLRIFRRFQLEHKVPYERIDDDFLLAFQGHMASFARSTVKRQDEILSSVHDFLKWADDRGRLVNHVQTRPKGEYDLPDDYLFPISSQLVTVTGRHGKSYQKWVSTLTGGASHSTYGSRRTPTSEEVLTLGEVVDSDERNGIRNKLIMDWALFTGARISEIVQLRETDLPPFDDIQAFFDDDGGMKVFEVWVDRKNRGRSVLRVPGDLALRTAEYIALDAQRARIIDSTPRGNRRNDEFIFLSERGGVLNTDSVTRIFRHFFKKAGIKKANIHRLRAKFITEMIEFQLDRYAAGGIDVDPTSSWRDTVLVQACQAMGHSHPLSLLPYLTEILNRRQTKDGKIEPRSVETRERSLRDAVKQLSASLSLFPQLGEIQKLVAEKRIDQALELVGDFQQQLKEML